MDIVSTFVFSESKKEELKEKEKRLSEIDKALNLDLSDDKQKNMTAENNEAEAEM